MKTNTPFDAIFPTLTKPCKKFFNYYEAYHRYFAPFIGTSPTVIEIGVDDGGSLELWSKYFGAGTRVVGVDINPKCARFNDPEVGGVGIEVMIGDQSNAAFLDKLVENVPRPQIIIDDGGHVSSEMIPTFEKLFPTLVDGGVYLCEDLGRCYLNKYAGGVKKRGTFIEYFKGLVDELHGAFHNPSPLTSMINSLAIYEQVVIVEKTSNRPLAVKWRQPDSGVS